MIYHSHILAFLLSLQLFIGGQARTPYSFTPSIQEYTAKQADGSKEALWFIPLDAIPLMHAIGACLLSAAALIAWPATRPYGAIFSLVISTVFFYVHLVVGESNVLPVFNFILAGAILAVSS